ncbi:hypothetical protein V1478_001989 [Vespula squamosa]|uniref:Uncharacterized protein n=1 Tax=Vespula squamosa TaxID=30214 RepID=A0ABD2BYP6_VESSQ
MKDLYRHWSLAVFVDCLLFETSNRKIMPHPFSSSKIVSNDRKTSIAGLPTFDANAFTVFMLTSLFLPIYAFFFLSIKVDLKSISHIESTAY